MVPGSGAGAFAQREAPFQHRAHSVLLRNPADVPLLLPAALLELRPPSSSSSTPARVHPATSVGSEGQVLR